MRLFLEPRVGEVGIPLSRLENHHSVTGFRGPRSDHASTGPASDHTHIGDVFARRLGDRRTETGERFGYPGDRRGRNVVNALPERMGVVLDSLGIVQSRRKALGRLESSSLRPDSTRRPTLEVLLSPARVEGGESDRATGQQKVREGAFECSQQGGELLTLASRQFRDGCDHVTIDSHGTRGGIGRTRGITGKTGTNRIYEGGDREGRRRRHRRGDAPPLFRPFIVRGLGLELRSLLEPAELTLEEPSVRGPLR